MNQGFPPRFTGVSDRLDIVRLIDSKVTATRRTVARSKQLVDAAKDDLTTHEEWLERHRRGAQEDSERYQRRLGRRRRIEGCKRLALWLLLLVPSACAAMFRAACRGLAAVGEAFYFSCCWIGTTARALCRRLIRLITGGVSLAGTTLLTLALWVAAAFWLVASGLGAGAGSAVLSAFRRRLARHVLAWPQLLARSGLVVWLLPGRSPDGEPRRLAISARSKGRSRPSPRDGGKAPSVPLKGLSLASTRGVCDRRPSSACAPSMTGCRPAFTPWTGITLARPAPRAP